MQNIQLHPRIEQLIVFYKFVWMWPNESDSKFREIGKKFIHLLASIVFFVALVGGAVQSNSINESIFLTVVCLSDLVVIKKQTFMLWKSKEIDGFIQDFVNHSIADRDQYLRTGRKLQNLMNFLSFYLVLVLMCMSFIIILPAFSEDRVLPFNIAFPFDWKHSTLVYGIAYSYVIVMSASHIIASTFTVIIWYLMENCAIKYEVIGTELKNVCLITATGKCKISDAEKQSLTLRKLIELIKAHRNIQESIERFRQRTSDLFLIQITTSGLSLCGSIFMLAFGSHANLAEIGLYATVLLYNIFDIFMIMYFGNEIKVCSHQLSYRLFQSNWMDQSKSFKVCMVILSEFLKQPQELVIFKLYPLNLETFTSILDFAYSMFNILKAFK